MLSEVRDRRAAACDVVNKVRSARRSALLLSVGWLAIVSPSTPAQAACSPDPTVANGTTTCTGTDSDGVTAATDQTVIRVTPGAAVGGGAARPIASLGADSRLIVEGTIDGRMMSPSGAAVLFGAARPRLEVAAGGSVFGAEAAVRYDPASAGTLSIDNAGRIEASGTAIQLQSSPVAGLSLVNRSGGLVHGAVAIGAVPPPAFTGDMAFLSRLDNAGTITGTSGRAIDLTGFFESQRGSIGTLINRAGGRIEGELVIGGLGQFVNAGVMDGGTHSVLNPSAQSFAQWTNSGTITSRRADGPTFAAGSFVLDNSGTLENTGGGAAVVASNFSTVRNLAGGTISSTGAVALRLGQGSTLDNAGRITGDVEFTGFFGNDRVIQRGTIQGSVRLGDGNDSFLVDAGAGLNGTGVTGSIDAGAGDDVFGYTTLGTASAVLGALPATFERYVLEAAATDAVLSVTGSIGSATLTTQGSGTVITAIDITRTGTSAILAGASTTINRGSIDFTGVDQFNQRSIALGGRVINEGTVVARGDKSLVTSSASNFENRGTVRLIDGAALASSGSITNLGTIELATATSQLLAREPFASGPSNLDNRGTITAIGTAFVADPNINFSTIINSGTIRAGARAIDRSGTTSVFATATIENRAGGTIEGAGAAILGGIGRESVTNDGRIIGTVDLGAGADSILSTGRIEGDLRLGDGDDLFIVDVAAPGVVTGSIDAGAGTDTRRLLARSDAIVDVAADARFELTELVVNGAQSTAGVRPVVENRTSLSTSGPRPAVSVAGNVEFTNVAALAAGGAGASAIATGVLGSGVPTTVNEAAITVRDEATGVRVNAGLLDNRGTITGTGRGVVLAAGRVDNSGSVSTTGAALQLLGSGTSYVFNRGTLESSAGPAVVHGDGTTTFRNLKGGVVRGGAGLAYEGGFGVDVVSNAGSFVGDVSLGGSSDSYRFDGGAIEGRLLLGAGNDRVNVGERGFDVLLATGGVDGGDGEDLYGVSVSSSRSLDLVKVAGFEGVGIEARGTGTEVTLKTGPAGSAPLDVLLEVSGDGAVVNERSLARTGGSLVQVLGSGILGPDQTPFRFTNRATLDVADTAMGPAVAAIDVAFGTPSLAVNEGEVRARGARASGMRFGGGFFGDQADSIAVLNRGTIAATGGASGITASGPGTVSNASVITTDSQSVGIRGGSGASLLNEGRIAGDGTGVSLASEFFGTALFTNRGTVEVAGAAVAGANSSGIVNSGQLTSIGGAAVRFDSPFSGFSLATLVNETGGTITGIGEAITASPNISVYVGNRGTITGSVNFASGTSQTVSSGDMFFAANGSRVTGDVRFGASDDFFVVSLAQAADPGASISGVLDMGGGTDTLRLRADSSTAATVMTTAAGFERVAYEAAGRDTTLALGSPAALSALVLTGDGTIDLAADFQATGTALTVSPLSTASMLDEPGSAVAMGPRVVSRGTIVAGPIGSTSFQTAAVSLTNAERFENAGTIRLTQDAGLSFSRAAISGTGAIVNSGRIEIAEGNTGIVGAGISTTVVNSGTIEQVSGQSAGGLNSVRTLENSGTVRVSGTAVQANQTRIINSGTIESLAGSAIFGSALIVNTSTGRISGVPGANAIIGAGDDVLVNAGSIIGNVDLGSGNDLFIAAGGRIDGAVVLGSGDDTFLVRGDAAAAAGGVTSGTGRDAFGRSFDASANYVLDKPAAYELHAVEAAGAATTVTLSATTAAEGGLRVFGTGTVDNRADINLGGTFDPGVTTVPAAIELRRIGDTLADPTLRFINRANVASTGVGVQSSGDAFVGAGFARFENSGVIDSRFEAADLRAAARAEGVDVVNSGTLRSSEGAAALSLDIKLSAADLAAAALPVVGVTNSGTITNSAVTAAASGVEIGAGGADLRVANSGAIEAAGSGSAALSLAATQLTLANTGRMVATGRGSDALHIDLVTLDEFGNVRPITAVSRITNDGLIRSTGSARYGGFFASAGEVVAPSTALTIESSAAVELTNGPSGVLEATGDRSAAVLLIGADPTAPTLALVNRGTIRGTGAALIDRENFGFSIGTSQRVLAGAIHSVNATDAITNATGGLIVGAIDLGTGNDSLENFGRIEGDIRLGDGDDSFVQALAGTLVGTADGGEGNDRLVLDITGGGTIDFGQFTGFEAISQRGKGVVTFAGTGDGPLPIQSYELADTSFEVGSGQTFATRGGVSLVGSAGSETVTNAGTIAGTVDLGGGDDVVTNFGVIGGSVLLGAGNDRYVTNGVATVAGATDGGEGNDTLEFRASGTAAAPTAWTGAGVTGFETLQLSQGTVSLTGSPQAFGTVNVAGGYLVGQAGTVLTAGTLNVSPGATFGTSGRVIGNINVAGTLSPGSSPGTATVTGNVALAAGSTTLFELTPTISDQLLISGTLTIAQGATLTLTGDRPLDPGAAYDLIVADGGITGSFATINKPASILGFVAQRGNRIQLLGQFASDPAFSAPVRAAIDHVNAVLVGGQASPALLGALPSLLTAQGATSAERFAQLTPEAYATAASLGASRALALATTARNAARAAPGEAGAFGYAGGIAGWADVEGGAARGASNAEFETRGVLGGVGYAFEGGSSVGAFVGTLDGDARVAGLGARVEADGIVAGVQGRFVAGGFDVDALVAYDGGDADLSRPVAAANGTANGRFNLKSWLVDVSAGYRAALSPAWSVTPRAGIVHVATDRGSSSERGAGAFALDVGGATSKLWFGDATVTVEGRVSGVAPYASLGVRYRLDGDGPVAAARLGGTTVAPIVVAGAGLGETVATLATGFAVDLGRGLRLTAGYNGEFGDRESHSASTALSLRF